MLQVRLLDFWHNKELVLVDEGLNEHLKRKHINLRRGEFRDCSSFMIQYVGLIREEVDLLRDCVGESIFTRHYFNRSFIELRERTLKTVEKLQTRTYAQPFFFFSLK
jgi:hypothetical protein